jgi:CheY-like chemotaxis protein
VQPSMFPDPQHRIVPRVLVVEDEILLRLSVAEFLRGEGLEVIETVNADEAIAVLRTTTPVDVVVTDIKMPGTTDGIGLARFIRAYRPGLKVIIASGDGSAAPEGCPVDGFFPKPYNALRLARLIRYLLEAGGA